MGVLSAGIWLGGGDIISGGEECRAHREEGMAEGGEKDSEESRRGSESAHKANRTHSCLDPRLKI